MQHMVSDQPLQCTWHQCCPDACLPSECCKYMLRTNMKDSLHDVREVQMEQQGEPSSLS